MAQTDGEGSRRRLKRLYRLRDGTIVGADGLNPDVAFVVFETIDGGLTTEIDLAKLFNGELPEPSMGLCAAAFGMNTVVGNAIAGKSGSSAELIRLMEERAAQIVEDKEWSEGRSGPRLKYVLEAWAADARERGKPVDDETIAKVEAKLRAKEWSQAQLLENPGIKAQYDAAEVRRAMAKLEASKAAAEAAKGQATTAFDV